MMRNRFPNVRCENCGEQIAIGHPMAYTKRGLKVGQKWHMPVCPKAMDYQERLAEYLKAEENKTSESTSAETTTETTKVNFDERTCPVCHEVGPSGSWLQAHTLAKHTTVEHTSEHTSAAVEQPPKPAVTPVASNDALGVLAQAIAPYLESRISGLVDESKVTAIVNKLFDGMVFKTVTTVTVNDAKTSESKDLGLQHKQFATLLRFVESRLNVWLTGPVGSGKTMATENAAKALGLTFYHIGAMDSDYKLMGFINAKGEVVNTLFKQWYRDGGVLCLDEIDSWLPSATLALNAALANGHCTFPDGMITRHPDAIAIACANTWGFGATNDFVGRMKQDAAFLNRFPIQYDWKYDEELEAAIVANDSWLARVRRYRANARTKGLKVIISPRNAQAGAKLLASGMPLDVVEQVTIRQGMTDEQWRSIQ